MAMFEEASLLLLQFLIDPNQTLIFIYNMTASCKWIVKC